MWRFEVWHDGQCLHEEDGFESEQDACDEGDEWVADKIQEWKDEGCYYGEIPSDFEVRAYADWRDNDDEF